ncbi:helix-turn-helix transcriptional regulator (plasmid) [Streptomyces sp. ITFR-21]|nr:helix-turn-helix transcriptional regulator [Streptomyces sp. ITFR-21]WNI20314.1 helix-turn-helix transcriptional regulator [Streptomyces sp. ITFR-21]
MRDLAGRAQTSASQLSRIERGKAGAGEELTLRLAEALAVPVDDITRGELAPVETKPAAAPAAEAPAKKKTATRTVPYPGTAEGAVFHYTPEEAAEYLPWSALQLKRKAYAREVPFNDGGSRVTFTGLDITEISRMTAVRPLAETVQQRSA